MNARILRFGLLALVTWAPCAAQTPSPPTITVFVRHEGKPVAGAEGLFLATSGPNRLDPSVQLPGTAAADVHSHWILEPPRTLRAISDARGVLRFQGTERGVLLVRHQGLGALEHRLSPRTPTRLELKPMGSVTVPGSAAAKVALRHANLAVELPLLRTGKIELPSGRYTGFVLDGSTLWNVNFSVAPERDSQVTEPTLLPPTPVPDAAASWHPAARPDLRARSRTMRLTEETAGMPFACRVTHDEASDASLCREFWVGEPEKVERTAMAPVCRIQIRNADGTDANGHVVLASGPFDPSNGGQKQRFWARAPLRDGVVEIPCPSDFVGFLAVSTPEIHGFTRCWLERVPAELELPLGRTVDVTVVDGDGKPSVGAWVWLAQEPHRSEEGYHVRPALRARTDLRGTAVFRNAPLSAIHLRVQSDFDLSYYQRLDTKAGRGPRRVLVNLDSGGTVHGRVQWAKGSRPAQRVALRVSARVTGGAPAVPDRFADVDPNGYYVLRGLSEERDYVLEVRTQIGSETYLARKSRVRSGDAGVQLTIRSEDPPLPGQRGKGN